MTDRPTILLLPGNMCDARMWQGVQSAFAGWEAVCRVPSQGAIPEMASACLSEVSGQLIPIGFSMGGIVALAIAELAPDRVAALGLLDTNAGTDRADRATLRLRQQRDVRAGRLPSVVMEELKPLYFARENRSDERLRSLVHDMAIALGPEVFVAQSEALRLRPDYSHVLGSFAGPVFFACGEEDELCPPELHRGMAQRVARGELHIVPGAGHLLPIERPGTLSPLLADWLARIEKETLCPAAS